MIYRVKSLGADDCVDYKSDDYAQRLKELLPDYADVYFDNVGGEILDVMLPLVKRYGKVAVCGAIASKLDESVICICTRSLTIAVNFPCRLQRYTYDAYLVEGGYLQPFVLFLSLMPFETHELMSTYFSAVLHIQG